MSKQNLNKAFTELRREGYFAKQNFWCCQTCAWADVPDKKSEKVVFYHRQDTATLRALGTCYLAWAGDGKQITEILKKHEIAVEWDGSKDSRIKITI